MSSNYQHFPKHIYHKTEPSPRTVHSQEELEEFQSDGWVEHPDDLKRVPASSEDSEEEEENESADDPLELGSTAAAAPPKKPAKKKKE